MKKIDLREFMDAVYNCTVSDLIRWKQRDENSYIAYIEHGNERNEIIIDTAKMTVKVDMLDEIRADRSVCNIIVKIVKYIKDEEVVLSRIYEILEEIRDIGRYN